MRNLEEKKKNRHTHYNISQTNKEGFVLGSGNVVTIGRSLFMVWGIVALPLLRLWLPTR